MTALSADGRVFPVQVSDGWGPGAKHWGGVWNPRFTCKGNSRLSARSSLPQLNDPPPQFLNGFPVVGRQ